MDKKAAPFPQLYITFNKKEDREKYCVRFAPAE
jgi:hypothetical protein